MEDWLEGDTSLHSCISMLLYCDAYSALACSLDALNLKNVHVPVFQSSFSPRTCMTMSTAYHTFSNYDEPWKSRECGSRDMCLSYLFLIQRLFSSSPENPTLYSM